jgi:hypothetical protein
MSDQTIDALCPHCAEALRKAAMPSVALSVLMVVLLAPVWCIARLYSATLYKLDARRVLRMAKENLAR